MRKKKTKLQWSIEARRDLKEIQNRIEKSGYPKTAKSFVSRLKKSANRLRDFPESGGIVEELLVSVIREIVYKDYRILYHYDGTTVLVLTVIHGSRMLGEEN